MLNSPASHQIPFNVNEKDRCTDAWDSWINFNLNSFWFEKNLIFCFGWINSVCLSEGELGILKDWNISQRHSQNSLLKAEFKEDNRHYVTFSWLSVDLLQHFERLSHVPYWQTALLFYTYMHICVSPMWRHNMPCLIIRNVTLCIEILLRLVALKQIHASCITNVCVY